MIRINIWIPAKWQGSFLWGIIVETGMKHLAGTKHKNARLPFRGSGISVMITII